MEQKKQIDYDSLEWFDCKNNFPPMSIDLYVDSEHGYGIGRLGRRVKDKSIIWTVHLDSGDVYQVYAFYKVKRWAYMPKDEKTNTKLKYELMMNKERSWVPCYLKSEADKVISELEESHKKEVGQLLMEIVKLKKERDWLAKDRAQAYNDLEKRAQLNIKQEESIRHQKYKRCMAKAEACMHKRWRTDEGFDYARSTRHMKKWLELAEQFKEC